MFKELFYNFFKPPPDYLTPSIFGVKRNKSPDYTKVYLNDNPGFVVGSKIGSFPPALVGIPQDNEGHILVSGATGSGKTRCNAKPTLLMWRGAVFTLDLKGELYDHYLKLYKSGKVKRKPILFDPTHKDGLCYDPFQDIIPGSDEEVGRMWDIVIAIYPNDVKVTDPFWRDSERAILMAALLYYHDIGLPFIMIIKKVASLTVNGLRELCKSINDIGNENAMSYIGDFSEIDPRHLASFCRGLHNHLSNLAENPTFTKAFYSDDKDPGYFGWSDLERCNIFIRIPEDEIEQWSIPVRIMVTQLFRHLMRRLDKYSKEGRKNIQTLLLLDEFARFGKIELITEATATLRSKNVNICIMLQSLAQLDSIYGVDGRRIICDNCQFKVILRVFEVDTQKYFSELIGSTVKGVADYTMNINGSIGGLSRHYSHRRESVIHPHEFATLNDILFHTPYGFYRLDKVTENEIYVIELSKTNPHMAKRMAITSKMIENGNIKI